MIIKENTSSCLYIGAWKVPVEWKLGAATNLIHFTHDCTVVWFEQLIQTASVILLLPFSSVLGFTIYKDRGDGRAATHI